MFTACNSTNHLIMKMSGSHSEQKAPSFWEASFVFIDILGKPWPLFWKLDALLLPLMMNQSHPISLCQWGNQSQMKQLTQGLIFSLEGEKVDFRNDSQRMWLHKDLELGFLLCPKVLRSVGWLPKDTQMPMSLGPWFCWTHIHNVAIYSISCAPMAQAAAATESGWWGVEFERSQATWKLVTLNEFCSCTSLGLIPFAK